MQTEHGTEAYIVWPTNHAVDGAALSNIFDDFHTHTLALHVQYNVIGLPFFIYLCIYSGCFRLERYKIPTNRKAII